MSSTLPLLILPGLGNSGPDHWQSHWERRDANTMRLNQQNWDSPACGDWLDTLQSFLEGADTRYVVVAHSSACALVAHLVHLHPGLARQCIAGALLVSPSDPDGEHYPLGPTGFGPMPIDRMPFPAIVIASDNDIYIRAGQARDFAAKWGARFAMLHNAGHVNVQSGHGEWLEGYELVQGLRAMTQDRVSHEHSGATTPVQ
jgi:predicted alpha/beta hydrolase family esterase